MDHTLNCSEKGCLEAVNVDGIHKCNRLKCYYEKVYVSLLEIG